MAQYKKDLEAVKQDGNALQFVQNQTTEICLEAVKQNGNVLRHVQNQTPELCLEAVKQNGNALNYVQNQTPELCLEAVKQDGYALKFVQNQTTEICLEAVKQNGHALQFEQTQTPELCLEAVKQNGNALQYVNEDNLIFLINHFKKLNYIDTLRWNISMIDDIVQVGCQKHSYKTWLNFSQDEVSKMDDNALEFYNNTLFNLITDSYKDYK
jgi:hypothetical protein